MKKYLGNNLNNSNKNIKLQNKYKINNSLNKTEYNTNNNHNNKIKKSNNNINSNNKLLNIIQKDYKNKKTSVMPKYYSNK